MTDDEIIEIVEDHVSMGHGAWDMVSNEDLVAGFRIALATPAPAQPDPLHVANERGEGEPAGYFLRAGWDARGDGTKRYEQVADEYKNDPDVIPLYSRPARSTDVPDALYGISNDQINWPLVGALIEAHMTASRYHSPGTSNWGAWLYKSIVKAAREAAPKEKP